MSTSVSKESRQVQILIADDGSPLRAGVRALLSLNSKWNVCAEADDGQDAIDKVMQFAPDVVILDLPVVAGLEATRRIRQIKPNTKILILTMHQLPQFEAAAMLVGANAIVKKSEVAISLVQAVAQLLDGHAA